MSREPTLSNFFATYCRKTLVQQLDMETDRVCVGIACALGEDECR